MSSQQKSQVYIIAEAGVNHNGSIDVALEMVKLATECGADAIKFQTFKTELNVSKHAELAEYQKKAGIEAQNQLEMLKGLEMGKEDFRRIKAYCDEMRIDFISSPDDKWSVELLIGLEVLCIKIASAEIDNLPLLQLVGKTGKPVILSTGMSTLGEVERAINTLIQAGAKDISLLHCTSNYPAEPAEINLKAMVTLANAFQLKVGFSDHSIGWEAAVAATALGAEIIEKHFTIDKKLPGPDHKASADAFELATYIKQIRKTELILGKGVKGPQKSEHKMIAAMRRSIVAARSISKEEVLSLDMVQFKRPGTGISPALLDMLLGKIFVSNVGEDDLILWEYLR